ncbi:MAG: quinolinate synthase NadA [Bacteroidia bacterium]|nr:quinolinate synthase NadA [Bacteroidia bacterium]
MKTNDLYSQINKIKKEKDVVILSHYYMSNDLQVETKDGGFVDFVGDSLGLSIQASQTKANNILFCGVRFMAETALLVNETKQVFMPDPSAGCSLASSINAKDVIELRKKYPGVPVMGYINTYAETKTQLDVCCTSRNAIKIAASLPSDKIIFVPDLYMGQNLQMRVQKELGKELILWNGACEVHEAFASHNSGMKRAIDAEFLFHWEVPKTLTSILDDGAKGMIGGTTDILSYVKKSPKKKFYLASECDLGVALKKENQDKEFITPCIHCAYMKQNNMVKLLAALKAIGSDQQQKYQVTIDKKTMQKAKMPVLRMLELSE